ncbi:MAG: HAD family hydrolase [Planctomycetota bacterium]
MNPRTGRLILACCLPPLFGMAALAAQRASAPPPGLSGAVAAALLTLATQVAVARLLDRDQAPRAGAVRAVATIVLLALASGAVALGIAWRRGDPASGLAAAAATWLGAGPGALLIAPSLAARTALAQARRSGVGITDAAAFARIEQASVLVLDKAGVVTEDQPRLAQRLCLDENEGNRWLAMGAALEQHSDHPLARAIVRAVPTPPPVERVQVHPHAGVTGVVDGHELVIGSPALLVAEGIDIQPLTEAYHFAVLSGQTAIGIAADGAARAVLTFIDDLRPGLRAGLTELARMRFTIIVVTGERDRTIRVRLQGLWVHDVHGHLDAQGKLALLESLTRAGRLPVFVTASNDPALLQHPATISLGGGDAAIHLPTRDLDALVRCLRLVRKPITASRRLLRWLAIYQVLVMAGAALRIVAPATGAAAAAAVVMLVCWSAARTPPLRKVGAERTSETGLPASSPRS